MGILSFAKKEQMLLSADLLPLYTEVERSRELRMHSYILCLYAQRTRAWSVQLRDQVGITKQSSPLTVFRDNLSRQNPPSA